MKYFSELLGNDELCKRLSSDVLNKTLSHAYIIEGAKGSGKHTLARSVSAALACENSGDGAEGDPLPCGKCLNCRKVLGGKSPDVITVSREEGKAQMGVDVIRGIRENVRQLPNELDIKVYIIEDAHTMNVQAQNALLLTLEEPPRFVVFFLLAETTVPFLETIKSRAPILRLKPLSENLLEANLARLDPAAATLKKEAPEEYAEIVKLSSGYLGQAIELLDEKKRAPRLEARRLAQSFISELSTRKSGRRAVQLIGSFSKQRDILLRQLSELESAARDLIVIKKCEDAPLCFFTSKDEAAELSYKFNTRSLMSLSGAIERAKSRLSSNANVRLTLYSLAIDCGLL